MGIGGAVPGKKSAAPVGLGAAMAAALSCTLPAYAATAVPGRGFGAIRAPRRLRAVRGDAAGRGGVPPLHAARGAGRHGGDRRVPVPVHRVSHRTRNRRVRHSSRPRVGDIEQPVPLARRLCLVVAALRAKPHSGRAPQIPARRLEGRVRAARHDLRAVVVPGQHCRRDHRRHDCGDGVQTQGAYRLPCGHRRRIERRRRGQRRRRHHHHHDVDRRRESARRGRGVCCSVCRLVHIRHTGCDPAASIFADPEATPHAACTSTRAASASSR